MDRPPARPEGALLRLARQAAGMTIPDAVKASGVSKARWSQVESGYETRNGVTRPVQAKADTIARMARAVSIPPERLRDEGRREDAASILEEMIRSEPATPVPAHGLSAVPAGEAPGLAEAAADVLGDDPVAIAIMGQAHKPVEVRRRELAEWLMKQDHAANG